MLDYEILTYRCMWRNQLSFKYKDFEWLVSDFSTEEKAIEFLKQIDTDKFEVKLLKIQTACLGSILS